MMTDMSLSMPRFVRHFCLVLAIFAMTLINVGCGGDEAERDSENALRTAGPDGGRARMKNLERDAYTLETVDLNRDGEPDQWTYKDATAVKRWERDMNFDGKVDVWQYPSADGNVGEEEMDLDLDGQVDVVVFYDAGVVTRKMLSIDFTGGFTITKFYDKKGDLLRVERDENVDGKPEVFEYYEANQRVRIGWDEDGDGAPDRFDTLE